MIIRLSPATGPGLHNLDICFKYGQNDLMTLRKRQAGAEHAQSLEEGLKMEVHFGKPIVARVRKCRMVVVKKRRPQEEETPSESNQ